MNWVAPGMLNTASESANLLTTFRMESNMHTRTWIMAAAALFLAVGTAIADPPAGKGKAGKGGDKGKADEEWSIDIDLRFGGITERAARDLAIEHGVTGFKPIPPGIRKNLARGKPMPPGIQKNRLPGGFVSGLPAYDGYRWESIGTDLLLIEATTGLVADVLNDVFD